MKTLYKVVCYVKPGWLCSVVGHNLDAVDYAIGHTTTPKKGYNQFLFAFDSLHNAREFARLVSSAKIFEATTSKTIDLQSVRHLITDNIPTGTVLCADITLAKEVTDI